MHKNYLSSLQCALFLSLFLISSENSISQSSTELISSQDAYISASGMSPQSYSFMKQGNHAMNLFNGQVLLQIPIYTYKDRDFNIPISLTYNSSGFMPNQREGIVGLGWSLNAGGSITRVVNGVPDELYVAFGRPSGQFYGIKNNRSIKSATKADIFNLNVGTVPYDYFWNIDGCEAEPDLFSFSVPGLSGRFYIENNGEVRVIGNKPFKVDLTGLAIQNYSASSSSNVNSSSFIITADDGFIYYFGGNTSKLDVVYTLISGEVHNPTINTWHLTKIVAPDGQVVNYRYKSFISHIQADSNPWDTTHYLLNVNSIRNHFSEEYLYSGGAYGSGGSTGADNILTVTKTTYLEEIEIESKGSIYFSYVQNENVFYKSIFYLNNNFNQKTLRLDKIEIINTQFKNTKEYSFTYEYQGGNESRLFLTSVQALGENPYIFSYYNTSLLPPPDASIDHWGYWNKEYSTSGAVIPNCTYFANGDIIISGDERDPDTTKCKTAMLQKVIYPTKGYSTFDYEPHSYSQRLERRNDNNFLSKLYNESGYVGGARIKKVTDSDGIDSYAREFKYTQEYPAIANSSGILLQWPRYLFYWENVSGAGTSKHLKMKSTSFNNTYLGTDNFIQYSEVTEITNGNGYTNYLFTDYTSNPDENDYNTTKLDPSAFDGINNIHLLNSYVGIYFNDKYFERGIVKRTRQYKFNGEDSCSLVKETKINFFTDKSDNPDLYVVGAHITGSVVQSYKKYYYPYLPKQVEEITYGSSGLPVTVIHNYQYNNYGYPTKYTTTQSDGTTVNEITSYPYDYAAGTSYLDDMVLSNLLKYPIEKVKYNEGGGLKNILSGKIVKYKLGGKGLMDELLLLETPNPILHTSFKFSNRSFGVLPPAGTASGFVPDSIYKLKMKYLVYDLSGNMLELQRTDNPKQSFVWGYHGLYPIAQVVNAPVSDVAYTSFESDGKGNWTYSGIPVTYPYAHTGKKIYNLSSGNIYKPIHTANTYIISYWRPVSASALSIPGTITGYPISGRTVNGWKYYEHKVSGQSIAVIMGKGNIDELRLYPAGAQMTTYTYEPLIGMTSQSDANNRVTYYEYDGLGRLSLVRDQDKNVLKRICYNYAGQPEDCNNSPAQGTIPLPPGNLTAIAFSSSAIKVAWANNAANATGIELYRSYNGNTDYVLLDRLSPDTYSYNDTALQIGTLFYYKVRAVGEEGSSGYSNEASARTFGVIPNLLPIENIYMRFNSTVVLPIEATASSPVDITLQADNLPGFAVFQQTGNGTGTITFTPSQSEQGVYSGIKITAANPQNNTFSTQFDLTVNSNYVPVIDSISDVTMNEKDSIQVQLSAADQDSSDVLMWSYSGLPSFATAASTNRTAKITFKPSYGQEGTYRVKLYVNDGRNGKDSSAFIITVIHADNPNPDDGTIPVSPKDLAGQFIDSSGTVQLTWTNAAYNARRNEVYRSTYMTGGYSLLNPGDTTNKDSTSYIDSTVTGNTTYFYLVRAVNNSGGASSLVIKITTPSKKPVIHDIDDIYIERDSAKNINIIATDDPGDIITLLFHDLPGFASFTENGNGSGVLSISAVNTASGGYPITISAIDNYGAFSQKTINIIVTDKDTSRFYINFNNKDYPVTGSLWNSFNAIQTGGTPVSANTTLSNLKDDSGKPTLLSVRLLNLWPQNYLGAVTGNNSGVFPDAVIATGYYFYVQASAPQKTIRLSGLKANSKYDLIFYGNRAFSTDQVTRYTIGTQTVTLNSRNNTSNTTQIAGLSANGQGEIDIVVDAVMGKYAVINAMVIKEYPGN